MKKLLEVPLNIPDQANSNKIKEFQKELKDQKLLENCSIYSQVRLIKEFNYLNFSEEQFLDLNSLFQDSVMLYFRMKSLGITDFDYYSLGIIMDSISNYFNGNLANMEFMILNDSNLFKPDEHQYLMEQLGFLKKFKQI